MQRHLRDKLVWAFAYAVFYLFFYFYIFASTKYLFLLNDDTTIKVSHLIPLPNRFTRLFTHVFVYMGYSYNKTNTEVRGKALVCCVFSHAKLPAAVALNNFK